ncbi:MAG: hypothetical protein ACJ8F7_10805, partial [Gemmataceae bacterium]
MPITYATLNQAAQELVLADDTKPSPLNWRFKTTYIAPSLSKGRGYMQELRGRFDYKGKLDVTDVHDEE